MQILCKFFYAFFVIYNHSKYKLLIVNYLGYKKILNFFYGLLGKGLTNQSSFANRMNGRARYRENLAENQISIVIFLSF